MLPPPYYDGIYARFRGDGEAIPCRPTGHDTIHRVTPVPLTGASRCRSRLGRPMLMLERSILSMPRLTHSKRHPDMSLPHTEHARQQKPNSELSPVASLEPGSARRNREERAWPTGHYGVVECGEIIRPLASILLPWASYRKPYSSRLGLTVLRGSGAGGGV